MRHPVCGGTLVFYGLQVTMKGHKELCWAMGDCGWPFGAWGASRNSKDFKGPHRTLGDFYYSLKFLFKPKKDQNTFGWNIAPSIYPLQIVLNYRVFHPVLDFWFLYNFAHRKDLLLYETVLEIFRYSVSCKKYQRSSSKGLERAYLEQFGVQKR